MQVATEERDGGARGGVGKHPATKYIHARKAGSWRPPSCSRCRRCLRILAIFRPAASDEAGRFLWSLFFLFPCRLISPVPRGARTAGNTVDRKEIYVQVALRRRSAPDVVIMRLHKRGSIDRRPRIREREIRRCA